MESQTRMSDFENSPYYERVRPLIERDGYFIQHVFGDNTSIGYSYTYGLSKGADKRYPELAMGDMNPEAMNDILRSAVNDLKTGNFQPEGTGFYDGVFGDCDVAVVPVKPEDSELLLPVEGPVYLLVIPDEENRFPWNEGCDPQFARQTEGFAVMGVPQTRSSDFPTP